MIFASSNKDNVQFIKKTKRHEKASYKTRKPQQTLRDVSQHLPCIPVIQSRLSHSLRLQEFDRGQTDEAQGL